MADDAEKTEETAFLNKKKGTCSFFYACRCGTKEKFVKNFCEFF